MNSYNLTHLKELESEAIFILREVVAQFEKPVMLFSGGKDSIVMFHLARKAFFPSKVPFPLMHVDTGHNFPETIEYRDKLMKETGETLIVTTPTTDCPTRKIGIRNTNNEDIRLRLFIKRLLVFYC